MLGWFKKLLWEEPSGYRQRPIVDDDSEYNFKEEEGTAELLMKVLAVTKETFLDGNVNILHNIANLRCDRNIDKYALEVNHSVYFKVEEIFRSHYKGSMRVDGQVWKLNSNSVQLVVDVIDDIKRQQKEKEAAENKERRQQILEKWGVETP